MNGHAVRPSTNRLVNMCMRPARHSPPTGKRAAMPSSCLTNSLYPMQCPLSRKEMITFDLRGCARARRRVVCAALPTKNRATAASPAVALVIKTLRQCPLLRLKNRSAPDTGPWQTRRSCRSQSPRSSGPADRGCRSCRPRVCRGSRRPSGFRGPASSASSPPCAWSGGSRSRPPRRAYRWRRGRSAPAALPGSFRPPTPA